MNERARWELVLLDIEQRTQQVRHLKPASDGVLIAQFVILFSAVFVIGGLVGGAIVYLLSKG